MRCFLKFVTRLHQK